MSTPAPTLDQPRPGIYSGIPNEMYHRGPGVSKSQLFTLRHYSPAHLKVQADHPRPSTPQMAFGTAVHALVLEPDSFYDLFVADPFPGSQAKAAKDARAKLEADGKTVIQTAKDDSDFWARDDWRRAHEIAEVVAKHPYASTFLSHGKSEQSVYWEDDETGLLCKCRPDKLDTDAHNLVIDLKTAVDASDNALPRVIDTYGYDVQAAFYLDGCQAAGSNVDAFLFLFVEKEPPYGVALRIIEPQAIDQGRARYRQYLRTYAECVETGHWPAYAPEVQTVQFPHWHYRRK